MKKLFTLCVILTMTVSATAQAPLKMSYQAVVRNTGGVLQANQIVGMKISILQGSATGTPVYVETQTTTTNANGLATIEIGGGTIVTGTFTGINWASGAYYIKTETDPTGGTGYTITGTSQILSVPYALYAKTAKTANFNDLTNKPSTLSGYGITDAVTIAGTQTISGTTTFKGTTPDMEESLFDIKNKDGQTIFAVYNEGVRIWVADGAKGSKGGFAVGGFDMIHNYLDVSADSVRISIDSDPSTTKLKGGFAVRGYDMTSGTNTNYMNVNTDASGIINPSQNRILWYPIKNAFLTGKVLIESPDSIGTNTFASGYESKAKGMYSQALGFKAIARGDYSTAIGKNAVAAKINSFAFGEDATAKNEESYAIGRGAVASGYRSFAFGSAGVDSTGKVTGVAHAKGNYSFAIGQGSFTSGVGAVALGVEDTASGNFSTAIGYRSASKGWGSSSLGYGTKANGLGSIATGWGSKTESTNWFGWGAMANGMVTKATNFAATSFGDRTTASGHTSFATGYMTTASGHLASTFGDGTTAVGDGSVALGHSTTAQAYGSLVIGRYNTVFGNPDVWNFWDPGFIIGNGTSGSARSNAMVFYNSGIADLGGFINLNTSSSFTEAIKVRNAQALWYDGTYFSWGYGGSYNVFARPVSIASTASPGIYGLYVAGSVYATGGWAGSDARWKKDLEPLQDIYPKVLELQGFKYNWRDDEFPEMNFDKERQIGLIAQDVEKIFPELVKTDDKGYKAVSYEKLTVILLESLKEQQKQIDELKALVKTLIANQTTQEDN